MVRRRSYRTELVSVTHPYVPCLSAIPHRHVARIGIPINTHGSPPTHRHMYKRTSWGGIHAAERSGRVWERKPKKGLPRDDKSASRGVIKGSHGLYFVFERPDTAFQNDDVTSALRGLTGQCICAHSTHTPNSFARILTEAPVVKALPVAL